MIEIIISTIFGALIYLGFGWIVFEKILGKFTDENTLNIRGFKKTDEESSMSMLVLSCAAYSLMFSILFGIWINTESIVDGVLIGSISGGLIAVMANTFLFGTTHFYNNYKPLIADVAGAIITVALMAGSIVYMQGLL